jgi:hypothetical protein
MKASVIADSPEGDVRIQPHAAVGDHALARGLASLRIVQRGQVLKTYGAGPHGRQADGRRPAGGVEVRDAGMLQQRVEMLFIGGHDGMWKSVCFASSPMMPSSMPSSRRRFFTPPDYCSG